MADVVVIETENAHACVNSLGNAIGMPQLCDAWFANQIFWLVVALAAIYFILTRVALPRMGAVLAERQGTISNDLAAAEDLKRQAEDAEAAFPDLGDRGQVVGEAFPVGRDVVQPGTDHTGEHRPDRDRAGIVGRADAALFEATTDEPDGGDHPEGDHQAVDVERPDRVERRARNTREHQLVTRSTNATDCSLIRSRSKSSVATW